MDKKPLIGVSICAVVLLVLGSLSNVVGYQTVQSAVNDSPLFKTRTQRATNQQQNILTSYYLGKGEEYILNISLMDGKFVLLQKCIAKIKMIDDNELNCLKNMFVSELSRKGKMYDFYPQDILTALRILRDNPNALLFLLHDFKATDNQTNILTESPTPTYCRTFCFPGCILINILKILLLPLAFLEFLVMVFMFEISMSGH